MSEVRSIMPDVQYLGEIVWVVLTNHTLPPCLKPERQQHRVYDHHAFHEDAEPGDLGLQFGTRVFSSSKKF